VSEPDLTPEEQEELARELADELRKLKVEDVLINTLMTVSSIGFRRLGLTADSLEDRDLDQSRLAIDTMRALTPVLERFVPAELVRDFHQSVANLQLAYAKAASEAGGSATADPTPEAATPRGQTPGHVEEEQEAKSHAASESPGSTTGSAEEDTSGGQTPGQGEEGPRGGDG
jgi:hypothetical protein